MKDDSIKEEDISSQTSFEFVNPSQLVIHGRYDGTNSDSAQSTKYQVKKSSGSRDQQKVKNESIQQQQKQQQQQQMTFQFNLVTTAFVNEDGTIDRTISGVSNKSPINTTNTAQPPPQQSGPPPPTIDRSRKPMKSNNSTPTKQQQEQMAKSKLTLIVFAL